MKNPDNKFGLTFLISQLIQTEIIFKKKLQKNDNEFLFFDKIKGEFISFKNIILFVGNFSQIYEFYLCVPSIKKEIIDLSDIIISASKRFFCFNLNEKNYLKKVHYSKNYIPL